MKNAKEWAAGIEKEWPMNASLSERMRFLIAMVLEIQEDAHGSATSPSDAELLLEYHDQQREWWRTNTNDPHNIGTALYTMHCELRDIYDAIVSGDARRNFERAHGNAKDSGAWLS